MENRHRKIELIKRSFTGSLLIALLTVSQASPAPKAFEWESGDVIARYAQGFFSEVCANASDGDKRFAHIGIVWESGDDGWQVIHAMPSIDTNGVNAVPLESFLAKAKRYQVFRFTESPEQRLKIAENAQNIRAQGTPFDPSFDYLDHSSVYCTELIWLAYHNTTGEDMCQEKKLIDGREMLTIENIITSEQLKPVSPEITQAASD